MASLRPFRHALHEDRAPQGAAAPMAPAGAFAWRPRVYFGTPFTRIVHHRELYLWPQWVRSHGVPTPISAHPSRGSCPTGRCTYSPSGCGRMVSPRPFRHSPHEDRAPLGALPMAPVGAFAWRPRAHFGTPFTRIVPSGSSIYGPSGAIGGAARMGDFVRGLAVFGEVVRDTADPSLCSCGLIGPVYSRPSFRNGLVLRQANLCDSHCTFSCWLKCSTAVLLPCRQQLVGFVCGMSG